MCSFFRRFRKLYGTVSYIGQDRTDAFFGPEVYVSLLKDPEAFIFVTGAARRVEERREVKFKRQRHWGLSLGRLALLWSGADI